MAGTPTNAQIEKLARPLFPRYGLHDVAGIVRTAVAYNKNDGHVRIDRHSGQWSWYARPASRSVGAQNVVIAFPADYRRDAASTRARLMRELDDCLEDVFSREEREHFEHEAKRKPKTAKTGAQLDREIADALKEGA